MATLHFHPDHEFSDRVPWVLYAVGILVPILATLAVLYFGYPK